VNLDLDGAQRKLYDGHLRLAKFAASRLKKRHPWADMDELLQEARIGLCVAANRWEPGKAPFAPYSRKLIAWHLSHHLFGKKKGNAALHLARRHELPADDPAKAADDGGPRTKGDVALDKFARREIQSGRAGENLLARLHDLRAAVRGLPALTGFERKVLTLRFIKGLDRKDLPEKLGCSLPHIRRTIFSAVQKLREHFVSLGSLPLDSPLPPDGNRKGNPRRK